MKIEYFEQTNTYCTLYIGSIRKNNKIDNCLNLIKNIIKSKEFYYSLYRVDGINIPDNNFLSYNDSIDNYLNKNGNLEIFDYYSKKKSINNLIHAVGRATNNNDTYNVLPLIFDYFLETVIYNPICSYDEFKKEFMKNSMSGLGYFIDNNLTDICFSYLDSGDFMICFNKNIYNEEEIITLLNL